jgi:phosphoribosylformylglycinamidine (FGAM) synthase-like amidotransferase family enzyme
MHTLYDVKEIEQVSSIQFWTRNGGSVSERAWMNDSPTVNFRGIADEKGRLMVVMSHNTDIPDTWEREGENQQYFERFSPNGYAVGVNIVLYAYTH